MAWEFPEKRALLRGGSLIVVLMVLSCAAKTPPLTASRPSAEEPPQSMPYEVDGTIYYPLQTSKGYIEEGTASWYGSDFHRKPTSNKEPYDMDSMTAAHRVLPFNTLVRVVNLDNGKDVMVRINDRGPFAKNRIIDLSQRAALSLGMLDKGTARVRLTAVNEVRVPDGGTAETGNYAVQVALFNALDNAEKLSRQLEAGRVSAVLLDEKKFYRVLVGSYNDFRDAVKTRNTLRRKGYGNAFIIRENQQP
jgi:rare lipoprotein A